LRWHQAAVGDTIRLAAPDVLVHDLPRRLVHVKGVGALPDVLLALPRRDAIRRAEGVFTDDAPALPHPEGGGRIQDEGIRESRDVLPEEVVTALTCSGPRGQPGSAPRHPSACSRAYSSSSRHNAGVVVTEKTTRSRFLWNSRAPSLPSLLRSSLSRADSPSIP